MKATDEFIQNHPLIADGIAVGFDALAIVGGGTAIGVFWVATVGT